MIPLDDERGSAAKPLNDPKEIEAFLSNVVKKYTDKVKV